MFAIYLGIGITAGILAGLLGIGGGLVVVPALSFVFATQGISQSAAMHLAAGTSLASICITSIASIKAHHNYKAVLWKNVKTFSPGIVIGAMAGAMISGALPGDVVRILFSMFVFAIAAQIWLGHHTATQHSFPGTKGATIAGTIIGGISAFLGIGGGSLIVPYLLWCNIPIRKAVGTSSACGLPLAIAGTVGFIISGWNVDNLPAYSIGFIYWPAFLGIVLSSTTFAKIGARLAHRMPTMVLRNVFIIFLCSVGLHLLSR
ncbi:membrane protein [Achromatium sp. WMS1]|nr:membrane protein [Achromatium sp. WMS1]